MKTIDNPHRTTPWNITQLAHELHKDLQQCTSSLERSNCKAMTTIQIRELRDKIKFEGRKFTPGEQAVMDGLGIAY